MKLIVMGHARHGKDTVCEILRDQYGLTFESSSHFVADLAVRPYLAAIGAIYPNFNAMYCDRINHRSAWFKAIRDYNSPDKARLGRKLFDKYDVYCGLRNAEEFIAMRDARIFDAALWVDASERVGPEPESSCTVTPDMADIVIDNNGDLTQLRDNVSAAYRQAMDMTHGTAKAI